MADLVLFSRIAEYEDYISSFGIDEKIIDAYIQASEIAWQDKKDKAYALTVSSRAKQIIECFIMDKTEVNSWELEKYAFANKQTVEILDKLYKVLLIEAQNMQVDSALRYLEKKRVPNERFYMPRRACFLKHGITQALQDLIDDKIDILCVSLVPGAGKTTIEKMFHALVAGWFPRDYSLFYSHSGDITRMYYDGVYDIVTNDDEYTWGEIFPDLKVTSTNAKLEQFNVGKYKPFPSIQCTSVGAKNAGKVRASKFLLVDDMVGGIEEALNNNTLDTLWNKYTVDARQRKTVDVDDKPAKEIHFATRWSVRDVIGRIIRAYEGSPRVRIIAVPDIDPQTGKSNFDYEFGGMSVEFFKDQEKLMDDISYKCLYKQEPVEREGLLYHEEDIRRYETLPNREPDAILGVCDTKAKGKDYFVLPVIYKYDEDYYLVDCLCNKDSNYDIQYDKVVNMICDHNMQSLEIEANMGGDRIAHEVKERLKPLGQRCNITTKYTETNKETRIIVNAEWVKNHVLFKAKGNYTSKSEYGEFMSQLLSYSVEGKNAHDDVCDAMANFVLYVTKNLNRRQTQIMTGGLL